MFNSQWYNNNSMLRKYRTIVEKAEEKGSIEEDRDVKAYF